MKFKIKLAVISIYVLAFSRILLDWSGIGEGFWSYILLATDVVIFYLGISSITKRRYNLMFLTAFVIICLVNYLLHDYTFLTFVNGLREVWMIVLIFSFFESISSLKSRLLLQKYIGRFVIIFLIAQIPVTLYQFTLYGAGDEVGGTLGAGNSGILTLVIIPMVYMRIKQLQPKMGAKAYYNALFLLPVLVNETKISFVLVPLMFFLLGNARRLRTVVPSLLGGVLIFLLLDNLYTDKGRKSKDPFKEMFNEEYLENYLLSDVEEGADIPRFTKISVAASKLNQSSADFLFGKEVGAFKGGTTISRSVFAKQYKWLLLGSRPYVFFLLITGGWLLLSLTIIFVGSKFLSRRKMLEEPRLMLLLVGLFVTILFYNDALRNPFFCYLYVYFVAAANGRWNRSENKIRNVINKEGKKTLTPIRGAMLLNSVGD